MLTVALCMYATENYGSPVELRRGAGEDKEDSKEGKK